MYNNDLTEGNIFKFNNITFTDLTKQHLVKSYVWHTIVHKIYFTVITSDEHKPKSNMVKSIGRTIQFSFQCH